MTQWIQQTRMESNPFQWLYFTTHSHILAFSHILATPFFHFPIKNRLASIPFCTGGHNGLWAISESSASSSSYGRPGSSVWFSSVLRPGESLVQIPFHFHAKHLPMLIKNYRKVQTQRQQEAKISSFTTSYCGWIVKYLCSVNFYSTSCPTCPIHLCYCHF